MEYEGKVKESLDKFLNEILANMQFKNDPEKIAYFEGLLHSLDVMSKYACPLDISYTGREVFICTSKSDIHLLAVKQGLVTERMRNYLRDQDHSSQSYASAIFADLHAPSITKLSPQLRDKLLQTVAKLSLGDRCIKLDE